MSEQDIERDRPLVEIVIKDEEAVAKKSGRWSKAFAFGLLGVVLCGVLASFVGYSVLPWYHVPEIADGMKPQVIKGVVEGAATEAVKGVLMAQAIGVGAGFLLFFGFGLVKFGRKA